MMDVFLSASVPLPDRDRRFFETADVLAIREAVKAVVEFVLPRGRLTCGGHPAITPLLTLFVREGEFERDRLTVFQSALFERLMPPETREFSDLRVVPAVGDQRGASLTAMRVAMIESRRFDAAVIIGGMEGIFEETEIFRERHPGAVILPLASTGGAAAMVHREGGYPPHLVDDLTYPSLLRRSLGAARR